MPDGQPSMLGEYALVELIGRGGMGEVWRAERKANAGVRRRAAVKRILPQFQRDPVLRERFLAEARITARLEHPNIVQLLHFADEPEPYLVLEYIEGVSVGELLKRAALGQCALPIPAALFIVAEAADALDYAHRRTDDLQRPLGIVHRDVSPPNILLSFDGVVKVNDFGVARAADNIVRTQAGLSVGKIVYSAPEQARGETVDKRADVFSLGVVLWELLTLRPLVSRNQPPAAVLETLRMCDFPAPSSINRAVRPDIDAIVREALAPTPATRTANAGRLSKSLRMVLSAIAPGFDQRELARVVRNAVPDLAARAGTEVASAGGGASGSALAQPPPVTDGRVSYPDGVPRVSRPPGAPTMVHGSPMPSVSTAPQGPPTTVDVARPSFAPAAPNPNAPGPRNSAPPAPPRDSIPRTAESSMSPPFAPFAPAGRPSAPHASTSAPAARPSASNPPPAASQGSPKNPPAAAPFAPAPPFGAAPSPSPRAPFGAVAPAPGFGAVAPARPLAPPAKSRKGLVIAIVVVLAAIASAVTWYFVSDGSDDDAIEQSIRPGFEATLPTVVASCSTGGVPHARVRADLTFATTGQVSAARIRVNENATGEEVRLASCVQSVLGNMRGPANPRGLQLDGLAYAY